MSKKIELPPHGDGLFGQAVDSVCGGLAAVIRPWAAALLALMTCVLALAVSAVALLAAILLRMDGHAAVAQA